jgi:hypothetical protein
MRTRRAQTTGRTREQVRPNELRHPGRLNAMTIAPTRPGVPATGSPPRVATTTATRMATVVAALVWFAMNLLTDAIDGGPLFDFVTYLGTVAVTAYLAARFAASRGGSAAVALASGVGVYVSAFLSPAPQHRAPDQALISALVTAGVVFGAAEVTRRLVGRRIPNT